MSSAMSWYERTFVPESGPLKSIAGIGVQKLSASYKASKASEKASAQSEAKKKEEEAKATIAAEAQAAETTKKSKMAAAATLSNRTAFGSGDTMRSFLTRL